MKKKDWLLGATQGLLLTAGMMACAWFEVPFTESLEAKLYDLRLKYAPKTPLSDQILLVSIDDASISSVGRWPWPRGYVAELIRRVADGGPAVIGINILYVDPDQNQGLEKVRELKEKFSGLESLVSRLSKDPKYRRDKAVEGLQSLNGDFDAAAQELDNDSQLAETLMSTPKVVLPLFFSLDKPLAEESPEALERLKPYALSKMEAGAGPSSVLEGYQPLLPLPQFAEGASGLGHCNFFPDAADGSVRRDAVVVKYKDQAFPSLALEMARVALGLNSDQVAVKLGRELLLDKKAVPLGADNRLLVNYQGPFGDLKQISAVDVLTDKVKSDAFKNKLVLVGTLATGVGTLFVTPMEPNFPANGIVVTVLQNLLGQSFLSRPEWARLAELGSLAVIGLFVTFLLPLLRARGGAVAALLLLLGTGGAGTYLFLTKGWWLKIFYPVALAVLAYTAVTIRRFFFTEKRKELVEAEGIETNKMLGLSFQGQGMLDMAFEKFRRCPVDDAMKELLYNLAQDFERKRQFGKAAAVYDHIASADPNYKDIKARRQNSKAASETMIVGGLGAKKEGGTVVIEGSAVKPTLGRYEIQKELGRGAMGIVYLGKDPKINRAVAVKTLKFDDDIDEQSIKEIKERFFREAESAGTLNHPHIIRIYDAGEDNDISYIAMELLEGEDLKKYGEKANLLPVPVVLDYAATVADALDYAHAHGVVHRDIKPANIMRLKDGTLRVTDFGIARITASSKTATGTVMGTPSYMSPEQIAGKKVDGRADLFSLGVMLYEMLTGEKPFQGDSIATLLFKIANEVHPDPILKASARVTAPLKAVIDRALEKDPEKRYQKGGDMARDIREYLKNPNAAPAPAPAAPSAAAAPAPVVPASPPPTDTLRLSPPAPATVPASVPPAPAAPRPAASPPPQAPQAPAMPIPFTATQPPARPAAPAQPPAALPPKPVVPPPPARPPQAEPVFEIVLNTPPVPAAPKPPASAPVAPLGPKPPAPVVPPVSAAGSGTVRLPPAPAAPVGDTVKWQAPPDLQAELDRLSEKDKSDTLKLPPAQPGQSSPPGAP